MIVNFVSGKKLLVLDTITSVKVKKAIRALDNNTTELHGYCDEKEAVALIDMSSARMPITYSIAGSAMLRLGNIAKVEISELYKKENDEPRFVVEVVMLDYEQKDAKV